jgi:hypothetical protein
MADQQGVGDIQCHKGQAISEVFGHSVKQPARVGGCAYGPRTVQASALIGEYGIGHWPLVPMGRTRDKGKWVTLVDGYLRHWILLCRAAALDVETLSDLRALSALHAGSSWFICPTQDVPFAPPPWMYRA